jgi:hypothetical protein
LNGIVADGAVVHATATASSTALSENCAEIYHSKMDPCPCCGYLTDPEDWEIFPVCFWENDPSQRHNPDQSGGANKVSLHQAQKNFVQIGACEPEMLAHVRSGGFARDPNWRPL